MALFHSSAGIVTRSTGRTSVMAAAYITGKSLTDERLGETKHYNKSHEIFSNILTPDNAPDWAKDTHSLWNYAEKFEDELADYRFRGHSDPIKDAKSQAAKLEYINSAQTAQTLECALPIELNPDLYPELIEEFLKERFVSRGLVVEYAIHFEAGNPHFHAMMTRRALDGYSFSASKDREIVSKDEIIATRQLLAEKTNAILEREGLDVRVDHRSYKDMGLNIEPTKHKGWQAHELDKNGDYSRIVQENNEIRQKNVEVIFNDPAQLIKDLALRKTVFTSEDLSNEIMKRVGGDETLFAILQEKVNQIDIPNELSEKADLDSPGVYLRENAIIEVANNNQATKGDINQTNLYVIPLNKTYEGIRNLEQQKKFFDELDENCKSYADRLLIDSQEAVLLGSNINSKLVYSSKTTIALEEELFTLADQIHSTSNKHVDEYRVEHFIRKKEKEFGDYASLSDEQKEAIFHLCSGSNIRSVIGRAGSGKTTLLKVVADSYKDAGYRVLGTSFQGKAVDIMAKEIGIKTATLDSYLHRWKDYNALKTKIDNNQLSGKALDYALRRLQSLEQYKFSDRDVVIVDEANMVGSRLWLPFLKEIEGSGAKLITVQDPAQIKAHEAGDISRGLIDKYGAYEIKTVQRQTTAWQKKASGYLNEHNLIAGLKPYFNQGNMSWHHGNISATNQIVADYLSDRENYPGQSQLILTFLNSKVELLNKAVHENLKAKGQLGDHYQINGKEFSLNDRIVFTKNDNLGLEVKNVKQNIRDGQVSSSVGVKNGSFGTILDIKQNGDRHELTVKLGDERIVKFDASVYTDFDYGYAITINKAEGETAHRTYILFDEKMNANLTLIAMTRHREDCKGYLIHDEFVDFKDVVSKLGSSQKKELVSDYSISAEVKLYYERVKAYKECSISVATALEEIIGTTPAHQEVFQHKAWPKLQEQINARNQYAQEIVSNWSQHNLFVIQAGIRKHTIEVHAGTKKRLLSELEIKAAATTESYFNVASKTRELWQTIKATHPGALAIKHPEYAEYNESRIERDSLASVIAESPPLYRQFFKVCYKEVIEDGVTKSVKTDYFGNEIKGTHTRWASVTQQAKDHYNRQLHALHFERLSNEEKGHYNVVKSYVESRNNVVAFVSNLKAQSNNSVYQFPIKAAYDEFKQEKMTRDSLALQIVEAPEHYEKYFNFFNLKEDRLLEHAIRAESLIRQKNEKEASIHELHTEPRARFDQKLDRNYSFYDHEQVKAVASSHARELAVHLLGEPTGSLSSSTQLRYGNKGSISINISGAQAGLWHDFEAGQGGNIVGLISRTTGNGYKESIEYAAKFIGLSPEERLSRIKPAEQAIITQEKISKEHNAEQIKKAMRVSNLYKASVSISNSPAEQYLKTHRKIESPLPASIKYIEKMYDPETKNKMPAMVVFATDKDGKIQAAQVTYLNRDTFNKADISTKKRSFGTLKGSFVEMQKGSQKQPVYIAEGVETALSVREAGVKGTILASLGISNIRNIDQLETISKDIIICADNDAPGSAAAKAIEKAGMALSEQGYKVTVVKPEELGSDFNDVLKQSGKEAVRDYFNFESLEISKTIKQETQTTEATKDSPTEVITESGAHTPEQPLFSALELKELTTQGAEAKEIITQNKEIINTADSHSNGLAKDLTKIYGTRPIADQILTDFEKLPAEKLEEHLLAIKKNPAILGEFAGTSNYLLFDDFIRKDAKKLSLDLHTKLRKQFELNQAKLAAQTNIDQEISKHTIPKDIEGKNHKELTKDYLATSLKEGLIKHDHDHYKYKPNMMKLEQIAGKMAEYTILAKSTKSTPLTQGNIENFRKAAQLEIKRTGEIEKQLNAGSDHKLEFILENKIKATRLAGIEARHYKDFLQNNNDGNYYTYEKVAQSEYQDNLLKEQHLAKKYEKSEGFTTEHATQLAKNIVLFEEKTGIEASSRQKLLVHEVTKLQLGEKNKMLESIQDPEQVASTDPKAVTMSNINHLTHNIGQGLIFKAIVNNDITRNPGDITQKSILSSTDVLTVKQSSLKELDKTMQSINTHKEYAASKELEISSVKDLEIDLDR